MIDHRINCSCLKVEALTLPTDVYPHIDFASVSSFSLFIYFLQITLNNMSLVTNDPVTSDLCEHLQGSPAGLDLSGHVRFFQLQCYKVPEEI